MKRIAWIILVSISFVASTYATSFDCVKASTKVERLICENPELSKLDDELSAKYKKVLKEPLKLNALDITQKQWLSYRDRCESDVCIRNYYNQRLTELDSIILGIKQSKLMSRYVNEKDLGEHGPIEAEEKDSETIAGDELCKIVLDRLNNTHPTNYEHPCLADEILKLPGVTNPEWTKLDLSQHEDLEKKIITMGSVEVLNYLKFPPPEQQQKVLNELKQHNLEAYLFQLPPQFFGERKLFTLVYRKYSCGEKMSKFGEYSYAAWVTSDIKEIATGPRGFSPKAARPFMYRGQFYLLQLYGIGEGLTIYSPEKEFLSNVCDITLVSEKANQ
jgi:uncharacterized protein